MSVKTRIYLLANDFLISDRFTVFVKNIGINADI